MISRFTDIKMSGCESKALSNKKITTKPIIALGLVCCTVWFVLVAHQQAQSAPTGVDRTEERTSQPSSPSPLSTSQFKRADYVENEEEFAKLLERLRKEAEPVTQNLDDFVSDDVELDELLRFVDEKEALEALAKHESSLSATTTTTEASLAAGSEPNATSGRAEDAELERLLDEDLPSEQAAPATTVTSNAKDTETTTTTTSEPELLTTTTERPEPVIVSDEEYQAILERLRNEALERISHPADYVTSDDELAFVLDKLDEGDAFHKSRLDRWENNLAPVTGKCPICLEEMEPNDERELECKHKFHRNCIHNWAMASYGLSFTCPLCRRSNPKFGQSGVFIKHDPRD